MITGPKASLQRVARSTITAADGTVKQSYLAFLADSATTSSVVASPPSYFIQGATTGEAVATHSTHTKQTPGVQYTHTRYNLSLTNGTSSQSKLISKYLRSPRHENVATRQFARKCCSGTLFHTFPTPIFPEGHSRVHSRTTVERVLTLVYFHAPNGLTNFFEGLTHELTHQKETRCSETFGCLLVYGRFKTQPKEICTLK